jgi:hypothetical protein
MNCRRPTYRIGLQGFSGSPFQDGGRIIVVQEEKQIKRISKTTATADREKIKK